MDVMDFLDSSIQKGILNIAIPGLTMDSRREVLMTILELANQIGLQPKWAASTGGGEYHSACPRCCGRDRFYIQPHRKMSKCLGYYRCRQCEIYGDAIEFAIQFLNYSYTEAVKTVGANITERISLSMLKNFSFPQTIKLQSPPKQWITNATDYVDHAHKILLQKKDVLTSLAARGIPSKAVKNYKIGWSHKDQFFSRSDWGLDQQLNRDGKPRQLWIPEGLIIPTRESNGDVMRLKVRRYNWKESDTLPKYIAIPGSMNGLNIIGNPGNKIVVVVESELDAYAIDCAMRDFVCVIAVGSNIKNPDNVTDRLAQRASHLLICYDNDEAGQKMLTKWQDLYPHAKDFPVPKGKDIGEYIEAGGNIKNLFNNLIRGE